MTPAASAASRLERALLGTLDNFTSGRSFPAHDGDGLLATPRAHSMVLAAKPLHGT